jgi:hypothetical protein
MLHMGKLVCSTCRYARYSELARSLSEKSERITVSTTIDGMSPSNLISQREKKRSNKSQSI